MKKLLVALLVAVLCVPAMAAVTVNLVDGTDGTLEIYLNTGGDVVRGVALKVVSDGSLAIATSPMYEFNTCIDYAYSTPGYDVGMTGQHPYALDGDPGVAVEGASTFVVSMGYLDQGGAQAGFTSTSDTLVAKIDLGACDVAVTEDALRGGIVGDVALDVTIQGTDEVTVGDCWTGDAASRTEWESVGSPECWCASVAPRQCHGDANNAGQGRPTVYVGTVDLDVLTAAWNQAYANIAGQVEPGSGTPLICADFNHDGQGRPEVRVGTVDLDILTIHWNSQTTPADCQDVIGEQEPTI